MLVNGLDLLIPPPILLSVCQITTASQCGWCLQMTWDYTNASLNRGGSQPQIAEDSTAMGRAKTRPLHVWRSPSSSVLPAFPFQTGWPSTISVEKTTLMCLPPASRHLPTVSCSMLRCPRPRLAPVWRPQWMRVWNPASCSPCWIWTVTPIPRPAPPCSPKLRHRCDVSSGALLWGSAANPSQRGPLNKVFPTGQLRTLKGPQSREKMHH